jgi:23S rRNA pseudouridine1911/1915/1917 synthase
MSGDSLFSFCVDLENSGQRLDALIAGHLPDLSRTAAAELVRAGRVTVSGHPRKASYRPRAGERIDGAIPAPVSADCRPEAIPLDLLYEDRSVVVVNKPPGMVVHPAPGHAGGTLVNALLHHCRDLAGIGGEVRPGIVHRLDKDTSGVMVAAKTQAALLHLSDQFKQRRVVKRYLALVAGVPQRPAGVAEGAIGRHPVHRKKMALRDGPGGRSAVTRWALIEPLGGAALMEARPQTGRTHQIRVHFAAMGHPILGDALYGKGRRRPGGHDAASQAFGRIAAGIRRQQLHAADLTLRHPVSGEEMHFGAPLPADMQRVLEELRSLAG